MKRVSFPSLRSALRRLADPQKRAVLQGFFKTGAGEYGEGDVFLGVPVPQIRILAAGAFALAQRDLRKLLHSAIHEERLLSLLILVMQFERGTADEQRRIFNFYLKQARYVNNWDLVDLTAPKIAGAFLHGKDKKVLYRLVRSPDLWQRRIAVVATLHFIRAGCLDDTLRLCEKLLQDPQDLMHKAAGWMLREAGKQDQAILERFLDRHGPRMPRTMLRYAIERFPEKQRRAYLAQKGPVPGKKST